MRATEFIVEYRNSLLQYVKRLLPAWPEYVLKDWLVPNKGDFSNLPDTELKNGIMEKLKLAGLTPNSKWQLVPDMKFTMDMFDPKTKQLLIGRAGGKSDLGMGVPRDAERHATQAQLARQQGGVRKEPVLLIKTDKGYELLEGWHRTIQHFHMYPDGYTGPAYVVVAQSQPVNEESKAVKYNGLVLKYAFNDSALIMKAFESGSPIAYVKFVKEDKELYPQDLWVNDDYRNKGIAKSMYDYLKSAGYIINRSHDQTKAGTGFWDKHRGEDAYVWEDEGNVQEALENWMEMESSPHDIQTILSSPESAPYKKPPNVKWLYRAIVPKDKDINSIKSTGQVVAFATDIQGAINFIRTLEIQDDWVIIRKSFNPSDFLLDFTGMYEAVAQGAHSDRYVKEHEVWMRPTPEYTSAKKNEIVYSSREYNN